jgi:hypothetical protein
MDKTYLMEIVRDMSLLWDQRDKNYRNWDLKPKLWNEIGEKLNAAGKHWHSHNIEIDLYFYIYNMFTYEKSLSVKTQPSDICNSTTLHVKGYMFRLYLSHLQALKGQIHNIIITEVELKHVALYM